MELNRRDVLKGAAVATAGSLMVLTGAGSASATTHPTLLVGSHGSQVLALQATLTSLGYWLGDVDGQFGDLTRRWLPFRRSRVCPATAPAGLSPGHGWMPGFGPAPDRPGATSSR
jgi:peptidoglycan hydrolase-like protein with peptidoglycan-binding domain